MSKEEYEDYDPADNDGKRCSEHGILLTVGCYKCDPSDYIMIGGEMVQRDAYYVLMNIVENGEDFEY